MHRAYAICLIHRKGNRREGYVINGKALMCCRNGKIRLPKWAMPAEGSPARDILKLWEEDTELGRFLREYSRKVRFHDHSAFHVECGGMSICECVRLY